MATLDDKLLGEKTHYYCSSSEDEDDNSNGSDENQAGGKMVKSEARPSQGVGPWEGSSTNTGPKGVIKDWQRFKQLEAESAAEKEKERLALFKKLSLTCRSHQDEEKEKQQQKEAEEEDELFAEDPFLQQYMQQRMSEMLAHNTSLPNFGKVIPVNDSIQLLTEIEEEHKGVTVIIHVFEEDVEGCEAMNGCLVCLSQQYTRVKFCKVSSRVAGMSERFQISGVPALLVYKAGQLVGNFVRMTDEFGDDFFASDVENFLVQHGLLPDQSCVPPIIRNGDDDDDDSE
ncbi:phosducin-like protein [Neocloeon triangulifer]|uniref:phosducin-like protein n=1 Tax=Neocloeon triangulifer TaxID=2078957 RepID=UPI00286F7858|nr:phosducin-like protein [Neocloeon triangulifer]